MEPQKAYKFCLRCGGSLQRIEEYVLKCSSCGFKFYINPVPCNGVIIEGKRGEIMLVKRKVQPQKGFWDLPGGFIEPNESLEESVKREIKEELNIDVEIKEIIGIYNDVYEFQNVLSPTLGVIVGVKPLSGDIKVSDDISSYKFFTVEAALKQKLAFASVAKCLKDFAKLRYT